MVVIWRIMDLAKQKAARLEIEATQEALTLKPPQGPGATFAFDVMLESGEVILETTAAADGLWFRIGRDGKTSHLIYKDFTGKVIGRIEVKRNHEEAMPVN